jgi:hypothetical protein
MFHASKSSYQSDSGYDMCYFSFLAPRYRFIVIMALIEDALFGD